MFPRRHKNFPLTDWGGEVGSRRVQKIMAGLWQQWAGAASWDLLHREPGRTVPTSPSGARTSLSTAASQRLAKPAAHFSSCGGLSARPIANQHSDRQFQLSRMASGGPARPSSLSRIGSGGPARPIPLSRIGSGGPDRPSSLSRIASGGPARPIPLSRIGSGGPARPSSLSRIASGGPARSSLLSRIGSGGPARASLLSRGWVCGFSASHFVRRYCNSKHNQQTFLCHIENYRIAFPASSAA